MARANKMDLFLIPVDRTAKVRADGREHRNGLVPRCFTAHPDGMAVNATPFPAIGSDGFQLEQPPFAKGKILDRSHIPERFSGTFLAVLPPQRSADGSKRG